MTIGYSSRWRVKMGEESSFSDAWKVVNNWLGHHRGSLGASLHQGPGGDFLSYARWPSRKARDERFAGAEGKEESEELFAAIAVMKAAILEETDVWDGEIVFDDLRSQLKPPVPTLTTSRLVLRPLLLSDANDLLPALSDTKSMRYWSRGPLLGIAEVREYIGWNVYSANVDCFAIEPKSTKTCAGWIVLIHKSKNVSDIGFILNPESQGKGYATEAGIEICRWAFNERGIRRIVGDVDPDNNPSIHVMKKLGFQKEGHHRATYETHIGIRDSLIFARLESDPEPEHLRKALYQ